MHDLQLLKFYHYETMNNYIIIAAEAYKNNFFYLINEIGFNTSPLYMNYFWALTLLSIFVYLLELMFPWRKNQPKIRNDFFLDLFYMYFNFFIFKLIIFSPVSALAKNFFTALLGRNIEIVTLFHINSLPLTVQIIIFFLVLDFVQWLTHVALHRFPLLWNFHKVHHSIKVMGFAAHLRYHWMENVIYTPIKFLAILIIGGFEPYNVFFLYYLSILIGHINHSNINISYGPLKYIFNNPVMHIWHHAEALPKKQHRYGVNFGISLSIWDYIFRTAFTNDEGRDIKLGFKNIERFPKNFPGQFIYPINRKD